MSSLGLFLCLQGVFLTVRSAACWVTCSMIDETNEVWFLTDVYHMPLYSDSLLAQLGADGKPQSYFYCISMLHLVSALSWRWVWLEQHAAFPPGVLMELLALVSF